MMIISYFMDIVTEISQSYIQHLLVIINTIRMNEHANIIIRSIMVLAFSVWSIFLAYHVLGIIAYKRYRVMHSETRSDAEIIIVSKGNSKVIDSLQESIEYNKMYGKVRLLIDEESEVSIDGVDTIRVPREYERGLVGKGRALNYFSQYIARDDRWYIFLDDDNLLLDDHIFYEISVYDRLGYVAANPILIPRLGRSRLTYIMDWMRYFDDILTFRAFTGWLGRPFIGMHGEMFTVKGSILKEIGFRDKTLTEDFRFASELVKHRYNVWQSKSRVSILSPNSMRDLYSQRGRWFRGLMMDLSNCRMDMRIISSIRLGSWMIGIFGSWAFAPLWIFFDPFWYTIAGGIIYWYIYIYGVSRLGKWRYLLLIPLYGILESFSWVRGVRGMEYVVIDKSINKLLNKPHR